MAEPAWVYDPEIEPDVSQLVTEDDEPLDNMFSEHQQRLLADCLDSYDPGVPFIGVINVGLFFNPDEPPLVPDLMLSLNVTFPADIWEKRNRSYFVWRYGKPPDLVIEVVSNKEGGEDRQKLDIYERIKVPYYVIYDPVAHLSKKALRLFELKGGRYVEWLDPTAPLEQLGGLQLTLWDGTYSQMEGRWLRWRDREGNLLATGFERAELAQRLAEQERERAEQERERAEQERERAEQEHERAERLAQKLRELGVDPSA